MQTRKFIKGSIALLLTFSLFSCSEDITLTPLPEDTPPTFKAVVGATNFAAQEDLIYAYTTTVEYDFNDEDNNVIQAGTYEAIRILGSDGTNNMAIIFPANVLAGTYNFSDTQGYYLANYMKPSAEGTVTNRGQSGFLTITLHNPQAKYVEGYFAFETSDESISDGEFKTYYTVD